MMIFVSKVRPESVAKDAGLAVKSAQNKTVWKTALSNSAALSLRPSPMPGERSVDQAAEVETKSGGPRVSQVRGS
ncbi:MAG: hypothetical protein Fues2KO_01000 [Fuerstiella sp.]